MSRFAGPARRLFTVLFAVAATWTLTLTAWALAALTAAAPSALLAVAAYALVLGCCVVLRDPDDPLARRVLFWAGQIILVRYLLWRAVATLPQARIVPGALAAYGFLALELFASWLTFKGSRNLLRRSRRSAEADAWQGWYGGRPPRVSVLIATYDEPPEVLFRTIVGASGLRYPSFDVWVLDDGKRDWLREMCARLGVGYRRRKQNVGYKSGHLNAAMAALAASVDPPEFVAVFDSDFVPRTTFLERAMALMHDPSIGIAQTPQFFFNADAFQQPFEARDVWPDDMRPYLHGALPCFDSIDQASCVGTSFVARCAAIEAIGGFATESVADDTLTSIKLRQAGFKTVYLDECLSAGIATQGLREYLSQRARWCLGNLQIAFSPWGALRRLRGWRGVVERTIELGRPALAVLDWAWCVWPPIFLLTGYPLIDADTREAVSYMAPLLVSRLALAWQSRGSKMPIVEGAIRLVSSFAILPGFVRGVRERTIRGFRVTRKVRSGGASSIYWPLFLPVTALGTLTLAGLLFVLAARSSNGGGIGGDARIWIAVVALERIVTLYLTAMVCVDRAWPRRHERFRARLAVSLHVQGARCAGFMTDVSESGMRVVVSPPPSVGDSCTLDIEDLGSYAGRVVRVTEEGAAGIELDASESEKARLIRAIYCTGRFFTPARAWPLGKAMRQVIRSLAGLS